MPRLPEHRFRALEVREAAELPPIIEMLCGQLVFGRTIYRGQSKSLWPLQSTWERRYCYVQPAGIMRPYRLQPEYSTRPQLLQALLNLFRTQVGSVVSDAHALTNRELLALGRLHGLITPLLDWTHDPWIAAHFAVRGLSSEERDSAAIWALRAPASVLPYAAMWNSESFPRIDWAPHNPSTRQRLQQAVFTELHDQIFGDLGSYLDNRLAVQRGKHPALIRIEIHAAAFAGIRRMLEHRGINDDALGLTETTEPNWLSDIAVRCNEALPVGRASCATLASA